MLIFATHQIPPQPSYTRFVLTATPKEPIMHDSNIFCHPLWNPKKGQINKRNCWQGRFNQANSTPQESFFCHHDENFFFILLSSNLQNSSLRALPPISKPRYFKGSFKVVQFINLAYRDTMLSSTAITPKQLLWKFTLRSIQCIIPHVKRNN